MTAKRRLVIGVIGTGDCDSTLADQAFAVGRAIAFRQCVLITGGRRGVMEAASRGAASAGGLVIGILPGSSSLDANDAVDIAIVTGMGEARNVIVARSADGLIALSGEYGTLTEIAFGLKFQKPVVSLGGWNFDPKIQSATSPEDAVERVLAALK
jgi:uncharacterized protein (TIGR00725 family)